MEGKLCRVQQSVVVLWRPISTRRTQRLTPTRLTSKTGQVAVEEQQGERREYILPCGAEGEMRNKEQRTIGRTLHRWNPSITGRRCRVGTRQRYAVLPREIL